MRYLLIACVAGMVITNCVSAQTAAIKFIVKVPESNEEDRTVYLAGSFNGWNAKDSFYIMTKDSENLYSLVVPLFDGKHYQYKYTRGSWNTVELSQNDSSIANRKLYSRNGVSIYDTVSKWKNASEQQKLSPELQKMIAMKDSAVARLKLMLSDLLVLLEQYNENMLAPKPNARLHEKLKKETTQIISKAYLTIESMVWQSGTSLSKEQKEKILAAIKNSGNSKDSFNNIINAYATVLK